MGQQEVYQFLRKNKDKWFTSKEISLELDRSRGSVQASLRKLYNREDILMKRKKGNRIWYSAKIIR